MKKILDQLYRSQVWRSIFRHGLPVSNRTRAEAVFYNFFLHVHPTKVRKRSVRFTYTWGLGGLSFGLFIILVLTGALLMLYYRPSAPQAYWDMKDLQFVVSSGQFLRNMHRCRTHAACEETLRRPLRAQTSGADCARTDRTKRRTANPSYPSTPVALKDGNK